MVTTAALEVATVAPARGGVERFVAREHERAEAALALERAASGAAQLIFVSGPSGIGKSWLCDVVAADAERSGFRTARGRCWAGTGTPALWPWPTVLRELGCEQRAGTLDVGLGEAERFTLFRRVADAVEVAARRPCLLVLDDVHLADAGALLLARFLVHALARRPVAIMLSRRTCEAEGDAATNASLFADLAREATNLDLVPFDGVEAEQLVAAHGAPLDPALVATFTRLTGGNPLLLARAAARVRTTGADAAARLIGDALAELPMTTRSVLAHVAILGRATIWEVATMVGREPPLVVDDLASAVAAGAVEISPAGTVSFTHEHVLPVAIAALTPRQQLDAHACAVRLRVATGGADAAVRAVAHAVAAAPRSIGDRACAVDMCRDAARAMRAGGGYERAAELLDTALTLAAGMVTGDRLVALQLERADAALACGRLDESRRWFAVATDGAVDAVLAARAALGAGGVWVYEHRDEYARDRVLGQQRDALEMLPVDEHVLRAALRVRLGAEAAYDGAPIADVIDALDDLREASDGRALAQGLSLTHHVLLAPEHLDRRRAIADELVRVASSAGDGLMVLFGLMWRTVDRYHAGDPCADRSWSELRERAAAVGCRSIQFIVEAMSVMRLVRAGRLDAAEVAAGECFELGLEVGDADALAYYGAHLLTIRWYQGRDHEIVDLVMETAASPTLMHGECSLRAAAAGVAARAGRVSDAAALLGAISARGLGAIPRSSTWLAAMVAIVDAAHALGDVEVAREAYELLAPFAALPVVPSLAVTCLGSVERSLGLAAATSGDLDGAIAHVQRAVTANRTLGNLPAVAVSEADLADLLVRRSGPDDVAQAVELFGRAVDGATRCAMPVRAATWAARRSDLTSSLAVTAASGMPACAVLDRSDRGWALVANGREVPLPALVGVDHLVQLVEHPGREVSAIELSGADSGLDGAGYAVLDGSAITAVRQRVAAIDDEIARARRRGRHDRVVALEAERGALEDEVRRGLARGGRPRTFATAGERARTSVTKALKRAVAVVAAIDPVLGAHLTETVVTGVRCCYLPPADADVRCVVRRSPARRDGTSGSPTAA